MLQNTYHSNSSLAWMFWGEGCLKRFYKLDAFQIFFFFKKVRKSSKEILLMQNSSQDIYLDTSSLPTYIKIRLVQNGFWLVWKLALDLVKKDTAGMLSFKTSFSFQEVSIFVFDKKSVDKLHKPKRKEAMTELLKHGLGHLQCYKHPKLLNVIHGPEDSSDALAFASEPVIGIF